MELKTLITNLNISKFKLVWLGLFGGSEKVYDYLLDIANTAIGLMLEAHGDELLALRDKLVLVRRTAETLDWVVPESWSKYFWAVQRAISAVIDLTADRTVTRAEIITAAQEFRLAYAEWRADDVPAEEGAAR